MIMPKISLHNDEEYTSFYLPVGRMSRYGWDGLIVICLQIRPNDIILRFYRRQIMRIRVMTLMDVEIVLPLYISYYNERENGRWKQQEGGFVRY